jgi:ribonuclease P protein component
MASSLRLNVLKKRADFLAVAATGKRWVAPGFVLQLGGKRAEEEGVRVGFTATKRIGNAVFRNRTKRRLRALAREILVVHAALDRDYVLVARSGTYALDYATLREDLIKALHRLRVWRAADGELA